MTREVVGKVRKALTKKKKEEKQLTKPVNPLLLLCNFDRVYYLIHDQQGGPNSL